MIVSVCKPRPNRMLNAKEAFCHIGGAWTVTSMTGNDERM
jgi:hypothetical protein